MKDAGISSLILTFLLKVFQHEKPRQLERQGPRHRQEHLQPNQKHSRDHGHHPAPKKKMILLSIGDPTVFENLKPAPEVMEAVKNSLVSCNFNRYGPSTGLLTAGEAIAKHISLPGRDTLYKL